jgi:hypothetical protein
MWLLGSVSAIWGGGCSRDQLPASGSVLDQKPARMLARTALGNPVSWPEGFDATRVGVASYSPDGRRLAFGMISGDAGVLDLIDGGVRTFHSDYGSPDRSYAAPL